MSVTIQMRAKGSITLPAELRQRYALEDGDVFTLVDLGDGSFLLVPRISIVPKLVAEIEALREEAGLSVEDLLEGLPDERRKLYEERLRDDG
jgi:bifunctional DNA-binding transcriptional regulator/antitoxin component of YhaV-PrlF toxin-antitoxin module